MRDGLGSHSRGRTPVSEAVCFVKTNGDYPPQLHLKPHTKTDTWRRNEVHRGRI